MVMFFFAGIQLEICGFCKVETIQVPFLTSQKGLNLASTAEPEELSDDLYEGEA